MSTTSSTWHLLKHDDGAVFGPVSFTQIKEWAEAAQISPLDKVSTDELTWMKAPMIPELEMDWLLQMSDDHFYGPTTLSSIQEFIKEGEIDHETLVINCKDATQTKVGSLPFQQKEENTLEATVDGVITGTITMETGVFDEVDKLVARIDALEQSQEALKNRVAELEDALDLPNS